MTEQIEFWRVVYLLPTLLAAFGMACVAVMIWRHRQRRGGFALWVVCVTAAVWAFGEGAGFLGLEPAQILFFWKIGYFGVTIAPLALMLFALDYVGYTHVLTRQRSVLLAVLPALTLLAVWTNEWHGLIWTQVWMDETTPFPTLANRHGPLLWVYFVYCTLLVVLTALFLLRRMAELQPPQRRQVRLLLLALFVPLLANILYMSRLFPLRNIDVTPLAFNIVVLVFVRNILLERLFELVPVNAHEIYRSLDDAVFVVDAEGRLMDSNQTARTLLQQVPASQIGQPLAELLPQATSLLSGDADEGRCEMSLDGHYYDVRMTALRSANNRFSGRLLVWREITERKRLEAELQHFAMTDVLTGLWNRRRFFEFGEQEIERATRYRRPLSLIMLDLDHFKQINDAHGHEAGDRVLAGFGALLRTALRNVDGIARLGGEEFAVLLPETDVVAAQEVAQRLLELVRAEKFTIGSQRSLGVTISAGVVTLAPGEMTMTELLRRADAALYRAKGAGRDQLIA